MPSVAIVVIGNEILSGKVQERNAQFAIGLLRRVGADLRRVAIVPDEVNLIADEVRACARNFDVVITSGGVGPTHDDVTYEGVSQAFGTALTEDTHVASLLERYFGERLTDDHLRMARFPENTHVHLDPDLPIPIASVENVYVLPGIPALFQIALEHLAKLFRGDPVYLEEVVCNRDEGEIAGFLRRVQDEFPQVAIGSYPGTGDDDRSQVRITIEGREAQRVAAAAQRVRSFVA